MTFMAHFIEMVEKWQIWLYLKKQDSSAFHLQTTQQGFLLAFVRNRISIFI